MRYLPLDDTDRAAMLGRIGAPSIEALFADVPAEYLLNNPIEGLPPHASELSVKRTMGRMAARNLPAGEVPFFCGAGAYRHDVPASVDHLIQRGEFMTSYTPYQPEIAQGNLQVLFEFQTQVARLFGCEIANASMYDGASACSEAIAMAGRITGRKRAVLSEGLHPHYVAVARTMARHSDDELVYRTPQLGTETDYGRLEDEIDESTSCVVVQYPGILGRIADLSALSAKAQDAGAMLIAVVTEPVALGAIRSPGEMGADIVVGEGQSLGVGLQFGGPYLGLFATRKKFVRHMPGRLCGQTVDADGKRAFVLTLSTREQHIRREKATSNICTNSGLCALAFSIHLTLLGEQGLRDLAIENHRLACKAAARLARIEGVDLVTQDFFNEFAIRIPADARSIVRRLAEQGILGGVSLGRLYPGQSALAQGLLVAVTETTTAEDIEALAKALEEALS